MFGVRWRDNFISANTKIDAGRFRLAINQLLDEVRFSISCAGDAKIICTFGKNLFVMKQGKVKFFDEAKGYGFIIDEQTKEEHFVHVSGTKEKIREHDDVTYDLEKGKRGMIAVNVRLA